MAKRTSNPKTDFKHPEAESALPEGQDGSNSRVVPRVLPDMLTPVEIERLRRKLSAQIDLAFKAFSKPPRTVRALQGGRAR